MKPNRTTTTLAALALLATTALGEMQRVSVSATGRTNATSAATGELNSRGLLYRLTITTSGSNNTNSLIVSDGDGSVILSNTFTSGTTTTNFATAMPFVGVDVATFGANSVTTTNSLTFTFTR